MSNIIKPRVDWHSLEWNTQHPFIYRYSIMGTTRHHAHWIATDLEAPDYIHELRERVEGCFEPIIIDYGNRQEEVRASALHVFIYNKEPLEAWGIVLFRDATGEVWNDGEVKIPIVDHHLEKHNEFIRKIRTALPKTLEEFKTRTNHHRMGFGLFKSEENNGRS